MGRNEGLKLERKERKRGRKGSNREGWTSVKNQRIQPLNENTSSPN